MKMARAGMLDQQRFIALLRADAGVLTRGGATDVLTRVQPRRTDGQDQLPKNQQRRQNSKHGLKHALWAKERYERWSPTSAEDCAESLRQVNQSAGSNAKLVDQTACFAHVTLRNY